MDFARGAYQRGWGQYFDDARTGHGSGCEVSTFFDRRESTANESGDFLIPRQEGAVGDDHIVGEIGEILFEQIGGRTSGEEVTLLKSLGLAVEDVVPAHYLYHRAKEEGVGTWVDFGDDVDEG